MERYTVLEDVEVLNLVKSLVLERKYDILAIFLDNLSEMRKKDLMRLDEYCRSMIAFHLEKREFDRVYSILEVWHEVTFWRENRVNTLLYMSLPLRCLLFL